MSRVNIVQVLSLTLTLVVFEFMGAPFFAPILAGLTLTLVVFEWNMTRWHAKTPPTFNLNIGCI